MPAITGKVTNKETGEPVWNAHILFTDRNGTPYSPLVGTVSRPDGSFSFETLGGYYLKISHIQFKSVLMPVDLSHYQSGGDYSNELDIRLTPKSHTLPEVVIKGEKNKSYAGSLLLVLGGAILLAKTFLKKH